MITIQEIEELKSQVAMHINAPYRYYHNMDHIEDIIAHVLDSNFDEHMKDLGILFALYHDIVYLPWNTDNEEKSIELMKVIIPSKYRKHLDAIEELIRYSKYAWEDSSKLPEWVWDILKFDIWGLISYGVDIPKNEFAIFKEYQFVDFDVYKKKRIEVLKAFDNKINITRTKFQPL